MGDIVERLKAIPVWMVGMMAPGWQEHGTAAYKAADEIAALRAENARLREAGKEAEWFMAHYAEYIATVPADEIERHPYLPDLQDKLEALRAALAQPKGGDHG